VFNRHTGYKFFHETRHHHGDTSMLRRRALLTAAGVTPFVAAMPAIVRAEETPGVTATEIRIGSTAAYSGPASAYGVIGKAHSATFQWLNDQGGVGGRKVKFLSYDDAYSPPKAIEQVRRLVEQDGVACVSNTLGTASNSAFVKYLNQKQVPHLFVGSGADKWGNYQEHPWTIGWQPSYRTESQIYARFALQQKPGAKIGILYQNDDFGKDYLVGVRDALKDQFDKSVVTASFEVSDATVESQVITLREAGVDVLISAATPKFAAQIIRKVADLKWTPLHLLTNVSTSVGAVMEPAGHENGIGIVSSAYAKDPTDPRWKDDAGLAQWRSVMAKYLPDGDLSDSFYVYGWGATMTTIHVLRACGNDLSRENLMKQAASLHDVEIGSLLPGIRLNSSATNFHPIRQMQLMRWTGKTWDLFGQILDGAAA
jgi:branched-chain amino acid transport system substrate-binding protein